MKFRTFTQKVKGRLKRSFTRGKNFFKWWLSNLAKHSVIVWYFPNMRPWLWRVAGAKVGKNVSIGWDVFLDVNYANLLTIEDDVWLANKSIIFCHRRDMSKYYIGERYKDIPQMELPVFIKKGATISIGGIIMPGVTVGEGAVVAAGAIVIKDVPAWSIVAGCPSKVIRMLKERE